MCMGEEGGSLGNHLFCMKPHHAASCFHEGSAIVKGLLLPHCVSGAPGTSVGDIHAQVHVQLLDYLVVLLQHVYSNYSLMNGTYFHYTCTCSDMVHMGIKMLCAVPHYSARQLHVHVCVHVRVISWLNCCKLHSVLLYTRCTLNHINPQGYIVQLQSLEGMQEVQLSLHLPTLPCQYGSLSKPPTLPCQYGSLSKPNRTQWLLLMAAQTSARALAQSKYCQLF